MGRKARAKHSRIPDGTHFAPAEAAMESVQGAPSPWSAKDWAIVLLLAALTFAVFGQVTSHAFLNFDDAQFISENQHVLHRDIGWALTSAEIGWYPLTWLSHMLDVSLWGQRAGMHLLTSVVLHALSTILLFLALRRLTHAAWPAAWVAALFAIHPMHVESVAWASERKDTLSTLFAILALWLYARAPRKIGAVAVALALSLMAKQMYITLPFVLLLLDVWPLGRLRTTAELRSRVMEKWPLFALSIAGAAAAWIGQRNLHTIQSSTSLPFSDRVTNALLAYASYLGKLFVPIDLALPYPLTDVAAGTALLSFALLAAITVVVIRARRAAPYLLVGWLWFLGTLLPVIGIVAIGTQSMADRYTYFSYIGLFIAIAFGIAELAQRRRIPRTVIAIGASIVIALCALTAAHQLRYWVNSETLFTHALAVTRDNPTAEYNLGQALEVSSPDAAIAHLRRAIELIPPTAKVSGANLPDWYAQAYVGIGTAMLVEARTMPANEARGALVRDAILDFKQALTIDPHAAHAQQNIAVANQLMPPAALPSSPSAPSEYEAYLNKGTELSQAGRYEESVDQFRRAVSVSPRSIEAHIYLGLGLLQARKGPEGVAELRAAKAMDPVQANEFLTKALHLPANPSNLDTFASQAAR